METALKEDKFDSLAILSVFYSVQLRSLASKRFLPNPKEIQHVQVNLPSFDLLIAGLSNVTLPRSSTQVFLSWSHEYSFFGFFCLLFFLHLVQKGVFMLILGGLR